MKPSSLTRLATLVALTAGMIPWGESAIVEFTIDSERTQVTFSGEAVGLTLTQQGPGSLTTRFEGIIVADVTDTSVRFVGGSRLDGLVNGNWSPMAGGEPGSAPADFGGQGGGFLVSGTGALRDLLLDLESVDAIPVDQGAFNADGLLFRFPEDAPSAFDYRVTGLLSENGRELLAGYATNQITGMGMISVQDQTEVLEIPIKATVLFELLNPNDSSLTITGQLVATRELNANPGIVIGSVRVEGGALVFEWTGATAAPVQVELSTDLLNWNKVADIPGGVTTWSVEPGAGVGLYRIVQ